jgi:murein L,D-transpeptidase YcbB/YkuD
MASQDVIEKAAAAARQAGLEPAALLAVAEVESAGRAFAVVDGRQEPLIRFEAHYFDRRLDAAKRAAARAQGLAAPVAGAVANPATQAARWRLLRQAAAIDAKAAYESTSWGLGQVMGAHWALLGHADVEALVAEARSGAAGQFALMVRYIDKAGLKDALRRQDWAAFARGYNGPGYAGNGYDRKIAAAYRRHAGEAATSTAAEANTPAAPVLRQGTRGEAVRELQRDLTALGYPAAADGAFGPATAAALKKFQRRNGLVADGIAGPKTSAALRRALASQTGFAALAALFKAWFARLTRRD